MASTERTRAACLRSVFDQMPEFRDTYMRGAIRNVREMLERGENGPALTLLRTVEERIDG